MSWSSIGIAIAIALRVIGVVVALGLVIVAIDFVIFTVSCRVRACMAWRRKRNDLYEVVARGFGTTREDAKKRIHLTTGERRLPKDLYEVVARGFGTTREDAKTRILLATYGGQGTPMPPPPKKPPA